ncbi:DUF1800 domain-containing protein [Corallibacter sp.]|uniref:DUF1800 domain-containing protein n=1 Tax=Corallibacter sp. TaxID=2038084 RepID=UPI003AB72917
MDKKHIQHLYWRASFGVKPSQLKKLSALSRKEVVDQLFDASRVITPLYIDLGSFKNLSKEAFIKDTKKEREFITESRELLKVLNKKWTHRLVNTKQSLRERMTLFWANHFVCSDDFITYSLKFNNTLRTHALGNFRDFIKAISKEAAMIRYLDLKQNRKSNPNENFARELMELFTLGVGNYTEDDIKESAKAFTGYNHSFDGEFVFNEKKHDDDYKYFFGKSGRYKGDDIIDIILEQKACATFICRKIYAYFVNNKINESHVDEMVKQFFPNYNIEALMRFVFMSDWFYNEQHIGAKIKSPIELLVGMQRVTPFTFLKMTDFLRLQKHLGQTLLNPPNVAGWKGGRHWIDSNTILLRLKLPSVILNDGQISTVEKGDFNDAFKEYQDLHTKRKPLKTKVNWNAFNELYGSLSFQEIEQLLITTKINVGTKAYLNNLSKVSRKSYCIQLMSLPEYQMC